MQAAVDAMPHRRSNYPPTVVNLDTLNVKPSTYHIPGPVGDLN